MRIITIKLFPSCEGNGDSKWCNLLAWCFLWWGRRGNDSGNGICAVVSVQSLLSLLADANAYEQLLSEAFALSQMFHLLFSFIASLAREARVIYSDTQINVSASIFG